MVEEAELYKKQSAVKSADMIILEPQDRLNAAMVGYYSGESGPRLIYDYNRLVDVFMEDGMSCDEAAEWVDYNIMGAYFGEGSPVIVDILSCPGLQISLSR